MRIALNYPAARRAIAAGASPADLVRAMSAASYDMAFNLLFLLSAEHAADDNRSGTTGWTLCEAIPNEVGRATPSGNTTLDFVHEDLLAADPTGREGRDGFS